MSTIRGRDGISKPDALMCMLARVPRSVFAEGCAFVSRRSITAPQRAAFVVHAKGRRPRGRLLLPLFPQSRRQRLNALTMLELALSILVKSSPIAIEC
jgi:hypothetical protein